MTSDRVAVVGLGIVSPHGNDVGLFFDALCSGTSAITVVDEAFVAARCAFDERSLFSRTQRSGLDRVSLMAVVAADAALADARRVAPLEWDADRVGVYVGSGFGGATTVEEGYRRHFAGAPIPPLTIVGAMANGPAAAISMRHRVFGPVLNWSVACASSSVAIAAGAKDIQLGEVDVAIVGGVEAMLTQAMIAAWQSMRTLAAPKEGAPEASCRPFSTSRTGLVLGEGAAFLVLERSASARARGAYIYAEYAGSGVACDGSHLAKPSVDGQVKAMRKALANARLDVADVGYCNAHGTATLIGDAIEAESLSQVWGHRLDRVKVSSTKALHGHLLGGAGALEAVATVLALDRQQMPVAAHCDDPDPACRIPLAQAQRIGSSSEPVEAAMSNSFAFGGTNSVLLFQRAG